RLIAAQPVGAVARDAQDARGAAAPVRLSRDADAARVARARPGAAVGILRVGDPGADAGIGGRVSRLAAGAGGLLATDAVDAVAGVALRVGRARAAVTVIAPQIAVAHAEPEHAPAHAVEGERARIDGRAGDGHRPDAAVPLRGRSVGSGEHHRN